MVVLVVAVGISYNVHLMIAKSFNALHATSR